MSCVNDNRFFFLFFSHLRDFVIRLTITPALLLFQSVMRKNGPVINHLGIFTGTVKIAIAMKQSNGLRS